MSRAWSPSIDQYPNRSWITRYPELIPRRCRQWTIRGIVGAKPRRQSSHPGLPAASAAKFTADQAERARVIKVLHQKGATLAQLARCDLTFDFALLASPRDRVLLDTLAAVTTNELCESSGLP
jgi:hypothetical protein